MARPNRKTVRISANIPLVIVEKWEDLQRRENDYLPLLNRSQRVELAILEHIRVIERRLGLTVPPEGGGSASERKRMLEAEEDRAEHAEDGDGPDERWHREPVGGGTAPSRLQVI